MDELEYIWPSVGMLYTNASGESKICEVNFTNLFQSNLGANSVFSKEHLKHCDN